MTIVVREDSHRLAKEKSRLVAERKKIKSLKQELDQAEQSLRKFSDKPGEQQNQGELQAILANLQKLKNQQEKIFTQRSQSLDERERALALQQAQLSNKSTSNTAVASATSNAAIAELRQGQGTLRTDLAEVKVSLAGIEKQLGLIASKINNSPSTVIVSAPASSSLKRANPAAPPVKRSVVNKRLRKALARLRKKGILMEDLPPTYQGHNAAIRKALRTGDSALANDLVTQLAEIGKRLSVDAAFVDAKLKRIGARKKRSTLDAVKTAKVNSLFQATTRDVTDGKYAAANRKLNEITALLAERE